MASTEDTTKLQAENGADKESVVVSVRLSVEEDKLIRRAAVELDTSRSEFMAEAAADRARNVLASRPGSS